MAAVICTLPPSPLPTCKDRCVISIPGSSSRKQLCAGTRSRHVVFSAMWHDLALDETSLSRCQVQKMSAQMAELCFSLQPRYI
eukprot:2336999-Pleurochrysis_carterae.AAC.2